MRYSPFLILCDVPVLAALILPFIQLIVSKSARSVIATSHMSSLQDDQDGANNQPGLPPRHRYLEGESTSLDNPGRFIAGEDTPSDNPIYYHLPQEPRHRHRNRDGFRQVNGPHAPSKRPSSAPPVLRAERLGSPVPRDADIARQRPQLLIGDGFASSGELGLAAQPADSAVRAEVGASSTRSSWNPTLSIF